MLQRWGVDNVNDLIVDESVDDFDSNRKTPIYPQNPNNPEDGEYPPNSQNPHTPTYITETPNTVSTDSFHHFHDGYNYPNPNKPNTIAPPPSTTTAGYLPTSGFNFVQNNHHFNQNEVDRYWRASATVIQPPPIAISSFSYSINQR